MFIVIDGGISEELTMLLCNESELWFYGYKVAKSFNKVPICMYIYIWRACIIHLFVRRICIGCDRFNPINHTSEIKFRKYFLWQKVIPYLEWATSRPKKYFSFFLNLECVRKNLFDFAILHTWLDFDVTIPCGMIM